jgi:hypothetical protein
MRNKDSNFQINREINDLRLILSNQALAGDKKLEIIEEIYQKSLKLLDYPKKEDDIKKIVELLIDQGDYEKVHEYCQKIYEDENVDSVTRAYFLHQDSVAFEYEGQLKEAFDYCFESCKLNNDPQSLSRLPLIFAKREGLLSERNKVIFRTKMTFESQQNFQDNEYIDALFKDFKEVKKFDPNINLFRQENGSLRAMEPSSAVSEPFNAISFLGNIGIYGRLENAKEKSLSPTKTTNVKSKSEDGQDGDAKSSNVFEIQNDNSKEITAEICFMQIGEEKLMSFPVENKIFDEKKIEIEIDAQQDDSSFDRQEKINYANQNLDKANDDEKSSELNYEIEKEAKNGSVKYSDLSEEEQKIQRQKIEDIIRKLEELNQRNDISDEDRGKLKIKMEDELKNLKNRQGQLEVRVVKVEGRVENHEKRLTQNEKDIAKAKEDIIKINQRLARYDKMFGNVVRFKSMDELMKDIEDHLAKRRQQEASLPSEDEEDSSIEVLDPIAQRNAEKDKFYHDQLNAIKLNFVLRNYIEAMVSDLNSFFIASKALQSKALEPKNPKFVALNYLKILVNLVPTLGTIGECVAECLESTYKKQKKIVAKENIARFASLAETTSDFEQIAMRLAIDHLISSEVESRAMEVRNRLDGQDNPQAINRILARGRGDRELENFFEQEHDADENQALLTDFEQIGEGQEAQNNTGQFVISCFNRGRARVIDNVNGVGSILGKKDALKLIELMQKKELIDEVARRREQPAPVDIRRRASIVADTIIEKLRQNNAQRGDENPLSSITAFRARNVDFALEVTDEQLGVLTAEDNPQQSNQEAPSPRMSSVYCLAILQKFIGKRK